ncbi:MAG: hypothetical protein ACR2LL_02245 [Nitrosopumilus sp.]|uniref:hypothetical protein n=1 Tax=Nitrosopumilus sp. TaxID=2024843 RepID=UPI00292EAF81|nr:hypothetical protein [Nitrosopumilus sp.]
MKSSLLGFLFAMWILILVGGGIIVHVLGPTSVSGFGDLDLIISSVIQAIIAIFLVILWIVILTKLKNWIFRKEIKS